MQRLVNFWNSLPSGLRTTVVTVLTVAANGGAAALGMVVIDPEHFNLGQLRHVAVVFLVGSAIGVINWVRKQPWKQKPSDDVVGVGVLVLAAVLSSLLVASCASFPPKNPDGTLNVSALIDDASYGIEADCALGFNQDVCTFGRSTIAAARAVHANDQHQLLVAVRQSLVDSAMKWPVIEPYVRWFITLLPTS